MEGTAMGKHYVHLTTGGREDITKMKEKKQAPREISMTSRSPSSTIISELESLDS